LQKELILVGFWLSQVWWLGILSLGSKIDEKVKSWFLSNLGGELSQMHPNLQITFPVLPTYQKAYVFDGFECFHPVLQHAL